MTVQERPDPERLRQRLDEGQLTLAAEELRGLRPADQADLLQELDPPQRLRLLPALSSSQISALLEYLIPRGPDALDVFTQLPTEVLTPVLDETPPGDVARLLRTFPEERQDEVLGTLRQRQAVEWLIAQEEETAGALVTTEFMALRTGMTAEQAVRTIQHSRPLLHSLEGLFVVDPADRLVGSISFRDLLLADPNTPLTRLMGESPISVTAGTPQEDCARLMQHYHLDTLPVVDEERRLLGFIDTDDVLEVAEDEATEDMYRIVGLAAEESVASPVGTSLRRRLPWLFLNLLTAFLAAGVVGLFESTIAKAAILAAFLPIVGGQGGNAIVQTITIIVRSIALGEVTFRNARWVLLKESLLGLLHGLFIGLAAALFGLLWTGSPLLAAALGVASVLTMAVAGVFGVLIPLGLKAAGVDPALAAGVFGTTVTDVLGFGFLLGLAVLLGV